MRGTRLLRLRGLAAAGCAVMGLAGPGLAGSGLPALAAPAGAAANPGPVSPRPALGTPQLVKNGGRTQVIRQLVQCGDTMYAVGKFTRIVWDRHIYPRTNIFSFSATAPYRVTSWHPQVNGKINSIAFDGARCANAYIGGQFTRVGQTAAANIAEIRTSTGRVVSRFRHDARNTVDTLAVTRNGHLLVGGPFGAINGSKTRFMVSLNPVTGRDDRFVELNISGHYHFCSGKYHRCSDGFPTEVFNQQLSHSGKFDLVEGVFTSVGGKRRQQIFMLNLTTKPATVTGWASPQFGGSRANGHRYPYQCYWTESFYLRSAAWSPDDSRIYTAETGFHPWNLPARHYPRTGLCDASAAWPAAHKPVRDIWISYTGCDSLYSVAADSRAVYVAGHPRWANNSRGCDFRGRGAVPDEGLQGLSPWTGRVLRNASSRAGRYSMSPANADTMLITRAGLWIGSTNRFKSNLCGGAGGHAGICFLPYPRRHG
jgi:hypothetical protein